jgi:hypothetical protein
MRARFGPDIVLNILKMLGDTIHHYLFDRG